MRKPRAGSSRKRPSAAAWSRRPLASSTLGAPDSPSVHRRRRTDSPPGPGTTAPGQQTAFDVRWDLRLEWGSRSGFARKASSTLAIALPLRRPWGARVLMATSESRRSSRPDAGRTIAFAPAGPRGAPERACAMPRKGAPAPAGADDRFDDSRHPPRGARLATDAIVWHPRLVGAARASSGALASRA